MDQLILLVVLSFSMFLGSYVSGSIPMIFSFSEERLRTLTVFGSGILIGTALSVILPEGVNSIYHKANGDQHHHHLTQPPSSQTSITTTAPSKHEDESEHMVIGITLVLGFIFMLLVDQCTSNKHSNTVVTYSSLASVAESGNGTQVQYKSNRSSNVTATLGLIVHAAADGVALGAAVTTSQTDVEMIIFLAIMLHKAPASFGLVTFLMHEGLDKIKIRRHLLFFSLSAPIGALVTFLSIGASVGDSFADFNATGIAMLFSAGTFLYVATVHVLPEILQQQHLRISELAIMVTGSLLPSLLSLNHHH